MPRVSHVSTTVTPGLVRSTKAWTICGPPGASMSIAWAPSQRPHRAVRAELLAAGEAVAARRRARPGRSTGARGCRCRPRRGRRRRPRRRRPARDPAQRVSPDALELGGDARSSRSASSSPAPSPARTGRGAAGCGPARQVVAPATERGRARRRRGSRAPGARPGRRGSRRWCGRARRPGRGSARAGRWAAPPGGAAGSWSVPMGTQS